MKNFLHYHIPGILWIAVILVLTCIPGTMIPQVPSYLDLFQPDKLVHLFLFAILVFLVLLGLRKQLRNKPAYRLAVFIALNIGIFIGGLTEWLQGTTLITSRQCSVYDFIADVAGCFLGWGYSFSGRKEKRPDRLSGVCNSAANGMFKCYNPSGIANFAIYFSS